MVVGSNLYFTDSCGSGRELSHVGRVSIDGDKVKIADSDPYDMTGVPGADLFVKAEGGRVRVEVGRFVALNSWKAGAQVGWVKDGNATLRIVDAAGADVPRGRIEAAKPREERADSQLPHSAPQPPAADGTSPAAAAWPGARPFLRPASSTRPLPITTRPSGWTRSLPRAYANRGQMQEWKGDFNKAIADYTEAIRLDPKSAEAYVGRGYGNLRKGDVDKAVDDLTEAIRVDPKRGEAYVVRASIYHMTQCYEKAVADLTEAIRIDPKSDQTYQNRAAAYAEEGKFDQAIADCDAALALNPKGIATYDFRGLAYLRKGDFDGAIASFSERIRVAPKDFRGYTYRGYAYACKDQHNKAGADYATAIRLGGMQKHDVQLRDLIDSVADAEQQPISLPAYEYIGIPEVGHELGLTPQQGQKLHEVSDNYLAGLRKASQELSRQFPKLPQGQ